MVDLLAKVLMYLELQVEGQLKKQASKLVTSSLNAKTTKFLQQVTCYYLLASTIQEKPSASHLIGLAKKLLFKQLLDLTKDKRNKNNNSNNKKYQ